MAIAKRRPYSQFNFQVNLDGKAGAAHAGFQECSGLNMDAVLSGARTDTHAKSRIVKITGINKSTDITLKRGVIGAAALSAWLNEIKAHPKARRDVFLTLQSEDGNKPVRKWKLVRARIIKHTSGPLNAKGTDIAIEELVLSCERIDLD